MPDEKSPIEYNRALEDFRKVRSKAELQRLWAALTGQTEALLPYDEITRKMHARGFSSKGLQEIPVDAIVGSVNRYQDFNHNFLPLRDQDRQRWASVKAMMTSPGSSGLPPIRVYKLGDAYFVLDGNHRVSIAKEMEIETVEAYVTEIRSKVGLSPDDSPEDIILKEEFADFLEESEIDRILPEADFQLTFPGLYDTLLEHIRVHRYYMGIEQSREIPWEEAVRDWYQTVYLPIVRVIREQNVLQDFPNRTEADLYVWILDHQTYLQEELGWRIRPEKAATDLVDEKRGKLGRFFQKIGEKIRQLLIPKHLKQKPHPNISLGVGHNTGPNLFPDILVAMSGAARSWLALEQATIFAKWEQADVRGLVVLPENKQVSIDRDMVVNIFSEKVQDAQVSGNLVYAEGGISDTIIQRTKVNDLVVLRLTYPPAAKIFPRLGSGIRTLVRRCQRPILMVREKTSQFDHMLLAYDGSQKGKEALYIATYLATKYDKRVTVLVVDADKEGGEQLLTEATDYLGEHCQTAVFRQQSGRVSDVILSVAKEIGVDSIVMGGYGLAPLFEAFFGSTVDGVLRKMTVPVLVCQ
ncbi:universal stress protein [bacterium]|nr:universal stress protein [bacterium]